MQSHKNRVRKKMLILYVTEKEKEMIYQKMSELNTQNFSQYARKMLIDGFIFNLNSCTELKQLIYEINKIGVNINQLTKLANENHNVSNSILNEVIKNQEHIQQFIREKVEFIFGNN